MSVNPSNHVTATGNLAAEPRLFPNSDGSHSVTFTVITKGGRDGKSARKVPLKAFIPKDKDPQKSIYAYMQTGDMVTVIAEVDVNSWTDPATGEPRYETVIQVRNLDLHTTPAMREERKARQARFAAQQSEMAQSA